MIKIHCINNGKSYNLPAGIPLHEIVREACPERKVLAAMADNRLKELDYRLMIPQQVEFIDYSHPEGRRCYVRSLCFVLQKAVRELFPDKKLIIDYALPSGHYCEIRELQAREDGRPVPYDLSDGELKAIKAKMNEIIALDLPFIKRKLAADEATALFEANSQPDKAELLRSLGKFSVSVYFLPGSGGDIDRFGSGEAGGLGGRTADEVADTFYGPLVPSTGYLTSFAVSGFKDGFVLQYPMDGSSRIEPMKKQAKIAATLKKHSDWCSIIGVRGIGTLNNMVKDGQAVRLINLAEARHERSYAEIADRIYEQRDRVKIVFIAGPSSSGKTSTSLRLSIQCKVLGLNPKVIELDNYFVNRERTPRDEKGNYDFEALEAMDLEYLNMQLNDLLAGREVEIPKFNFKTGSREAQGTKMRLEEKDILIMEGIHALNPAMTPSVDNSKIFRVYASALTSLAIDENNNISTSDNRLLRRMVRDNRVRGITPEETILRWQSVRRGENRNIFPFQENADAEFNSALIFELPMLKYYAEPLLRRIPPTSAAYSEATRMLKFLDYIVALSPDEIAAIPPTSIMREFIGGQTLI